MRIIILFIFFILPVVGYTQIVPPLTPPPPPPGLPVDGLTGALFIMGLIYGSKKIYKDSSS